MQVPFRRPVAPPLVPPPLLLPVGVQEARQVPQGPGVRRKEHDGISPSYTGKKISLMLKIRPFQKQPLKPGDLAVFKVLFF